MLELVKIWQARRRAVAAIRPLIDGSRRRLPDIPDRFWLSPYSLGFLTMLITLIAKRGAPGLDGQSLGLVQLDAWKELTGLRIDDIGEKICLFSLLCDAEFEHGCRDADMMFRAMANADRRRDEWTDLGGGQAASDVELRWQHYFDSRILAVERI